MHVSVGPRYRQTIEWFPAHNIVVRITPQHYHSAHTRYPQDGRSICSVLMNAKILIDMLVVKTYGIKTMLGGLVLLWRDRTVCCQCSTGSYLLMIWPLVLLDFSMISIISCCFVSTWIDNSHWTAFILFRLAAHTLYECGYLYTTHNSFIPPHRSFRCICMYVCMSIYVASYHCHIFLSLRKSSHLFTFRFAAHNTSIYSHRTSLPPVRLRWWFKWLPAYKPLFVRGCGTIRRVLCFARYILYIHYYTQIERYKLDVRRVYC